MKRVKLLLGGLTALALVTLTGMGLFKYFVTDQTVDKGGMMNPDFVDGTDDVHILDGDHTYVDNEKLLQVITGTWSSEDGHYVIKLDSGYRIMLSLDGEPLLDDHIQFVYLQPGIVLSTEFSLDSCILQREDGSPAGEITSIYHETSGEDTSGRLMVEIDLAGNSKTVKFKKQEK